MLDKVKLDKEAPRTGIIYALYTDRPIVYKKYNSLSEIDDEINVDSLLELHLFDDKEEYRYIKTKSKKKNIEVLITDSSVEHTDTYEEKIYVNEKYVNAKKEVTVVNYIKYTEDDLLTIVNYRLCEGGK